MTTEQTAQVATRFNLTTAEVTAAGSPSATDPCKKWKDAFYAAAALWLDAEMRSAANTSDPHRSEL